MKTMDIRVHADPEKLKRARFVIRMKDGKVTAETPFRPDQVLLLVEVCDHDHDHLIDALIGENFLINMRTRKAAA